MICSQKRLCICMYYNNVTSKLKVSPSLTLVAHAQRGIILIGLCVGRSVGQFVCLSHVFSLTVAVVDAKRGCVGRYNGRAAQQESGTASSKKSIFTVGA